MNPGGVPEAPGSSRDPACTPLGPPGDAPGTPRYDPGTPQARPWDPWGNRRPHGPQQNPYLHTFTVPAAFDCCIRIWLLQCMTPKTPLDCFVMYTFGKGTPFGPSITGIAHWIYPNAPALGALVIYIYIYIRVYIYINVYMYICM